MLVKDVYNLLDGVYGLKGVNLINKEDVIMYLPEALSMCYLDHSCKDVTKFEYENGYINIYI